jgi:HK97 family phage prohead protease
MERRTFGLKEIRAAEGADGGRELRGYAAVFNSLSEDLGGFKEKIRPGAFERSLGEDDARSVWNHNNDYVLGRVKAGTLELGEDERGLAVVIRPPDTQWARDFVTSIDRGDVDQMSFAFQVVREDWQMVGGMAVRELIEVRLYEVSPVTFPAYPQTEIGLRALVDGGAVERAKALARGASGARVRILGEQLRLAEVS